MKKLIGIVVAIAIVLAMLPVAAFAATNYYVAGESALCGSNWSENDANNIMTANGDVYTKTYSNVAVGTYQFKITNGTWNSSWGDGGNNYKFAVITAGDITITFNPTTKAISVSGPGVGEAKMEINYVTAVGAGKNGFLNNVDWNPAAASNKMTEENGVYTISYENVSAGTYEYKFAANGGWGDNWGYNGETASGVTCNAVYNSGSNAKVVVTEDGSTVTLTLDLSGIDGKGNGAKITATVTAPVVEEEIPVYVLEDGVGQSIVLEPGKSVKIQIDATDANFDLLCSGNYECWDWTLDNGMQIFNPNPMSVINSVLTAGNVYTWTLTCASEDTAQTVFVRADKQVPGTYDNPADLVMGENVASVPAFNAFYYIWTATEEGTLTISVDTSKYTDWTYCINGECADGSYIYGETHFSSDSPVVSSEDIEVQPGDVIKITVGTDSYEAAEVAINASFVAGPTGGDDGDEGGEGGEGGDVGGDTEGDVLVDVTGETSKDEAPWTYTFTIDTTGILNVKIGECTPGWRYKIEYPTGETSLYFSNSAWSVGPDYDHVLTEIGEYKVMVWAYSSSEYSNVTGTISCTLTFIPDEGEQEVVKEEYVVSDTMVYLGENTLTLDPTAITTIYEFCPDETGVYKFTVNNAMACVGYWGAGSFFVQAPEGDLINAMEYTLEHEGPSIMVGISDVEGEFTLTIERVGDVVVKEVVWEEYENVELEGVADFEFDGEVIALDVTDPDLTDKIFMDPDGLFRYGSPTGPVIVSMVADNAYISFAGLLGNGDMKIASFDDEGDLIGGVDFSNAMWEYIDAGNVPMTLELMIMLAGYGAQDGIGWYDADLNGFYLFSEEVNPEFAFLCFFGYAEGTEMVPDELGTVVEGEFVAENEDQAMIGETVTIYASEDGVVTVQVNASEPGYIVYIAGMTADGEYVEFDPEFFEGSEPLYTTFEAEAGCLYAVNICPAAFDEAMGEYWYAAGSVSYVVTYDKEAVDVEDPEDPEDPENPEDPAAPDYYVTGDGDLFGNWAADNANGVMTESADGVYKFTLENVPAGNYKFKVTDGTWDNCWGDPNSGDPDGNFLFSVESVSDVTITFNSATGEISVAVNGEDIPKTGDMSIAAIAFAVMAATAGAVVIGKKKEF